MKWPYLYGLRFKFVSKPDIFHSLFFQEFISQIKGHTIFWFIFAKELIEFRKKTAEFEAADNGLNAYYKNDTGA